MYIRSLLVTTAYAVPELPNDKIDQDGDGGDAIRQNFRANFTNAGWALMSGWTATGASFPGDAASIPANARVDWNGNSPYHLGDLYLVVDAASLSGLCTGLVEWTSGGTPYSASFPLFSGTHAYTVTTATPLVLNRIRFSCGLLSSVTIDWAVAQNGTVLFMAPHPFLLNTWFVAPMVQQADLTTCIRTFAGGWDYDWGSYFDACGQPFPRVVQRNGGQWRSDPLSIAGLPSLKGMGITARQEGATVEIAYATAGSGSFRGMLTW